MSSAARASSSACVPLVQATAPLAPVKADHSFSKALTSVPSIPHLREFRTRRTAACSASSYCGHNGNAVALTGVPPFAASLSIKHSLLLSCLHHLTHLR